MNDGNRGNSGKSSGGSTGTRSRKSSLVRQVWIGMLLACLFPILVLSYQSYHCSRHAVIQLQEDALNAVVYLKERQIRNWLDERYRDLHSLVDSECIVGCTCTPEKHGCRLFGVVSAREATYEAVYLYDQSWKLLQKYSEHELPHQEILTEDQKSAIAASDSLIFFTAHSHNDGSVTIHGGCRLTIDGILKGYVFAMMHATDPVATLLEDPGSPYILRIVDSDGYDVMKPGNGKLNDILPAALIEGTDRIHEYQTRSGDRVVGVSRAIPLLNWTLIVESAEQSTYQWLHILRNRNVATATLAFLAAMIIAGILSRSITAPFNLLAATARKISSGNIRLRVDHGTARESAEVAAAINEMLDSLERLRSDLSHQTALAAVGQLSSSVVHEMRNPLSSIRMNIHALARKVADDPVHAELAQIAGEQTDRLEYLLNELLLYGKPMELHKSDVPYIDLVQWIRQDAAPILENSQVALEINPSQLPLSLDIDPQKIRQVFINLIENAVQACQGNGIVTLQAESRGSDLLIIVRDTGPGISARNLPDLFQPFVTGRSDGTGLGLANVKKILDLHGGSVTAANHPDGGAEFTVTLPLSKETHV